MVVFWTNSVLLSVLALLILMGNTLFPFCLRSWIQGIVTMLQNEAADSVNYLLEHTSEVGYSHLFPGLQSWFLLGTVLCFVMVQLVSFCWLEWDSVALSGLSSGRKIVGGLFQTVNSRHAVESIVDLSAILVLFVLMMYLPPYTTFLLVEENEESREDSEKGKKRKWGKCLSDNLRMSNVSCFGMVTIVICLTEGQNMKEDPLNFNVLNIVVEVVSAYGNVGFTTGYSRERQLHPDRNCKDKLYGFCGKWSDASKIHLRHVFWTS